MIGFNLKFDFLKGKTVLEKIENRVIPEVMEKLIKDLRAQVEGLTPIDDDSNKPEGQPHMRNSWSPYAGDIQGGFLYFENPVPWAPVVEFGLYPKAPKTGTRTALGEDGQRYSTQAMGGVLRPLLENGYKGMSIEDQAHDIMEQLISELTGL